MISMRSQTSLDPPSHAISLWDEQAAFKLVAENFKTSGIDYLINNAGRSDSVQSQFE